jgi:triosephosphate isomerase
VGATHVIVGHSERRQYYGETDLAVNQKTRLALDAGLTPIVCVGETLAEREAGKTFSVIETQITGGLKGFSAEDAARLVIAYEPVWAIGTGKTATPKDAQEMHAFIRSLLKTDGDSTRILYGGSMNAANAEELLKQNDVDGGLIGGASLKPEEFGKIVEIAERINT